MESCYSSKQVQPFIYSACKCFANHLPQLFIRHLTTGITKYRKMLCKHKIEEGHKKWLIRINNHLNSTGRYLRKKILIIKSKKCWKYFLLGKVPGGANNCDTHCGFILFRTRRMVRTNFKMLNRHIHGRTVTKAYTTKFHQKNKKLIYDSLWNK